MLAPTRWMTLDRASEATGFGVKFFMEHCSDGTWPEYKIWRWVLGRKVIDLDALYAWIDQQPSIPTRRGRKRKEESCEESDLQAA